MKKVLKILYIICNSFILNPMIVFAEVKIEITQGVDLARPIGIVPFHLICLDYEHEDISNIIMNDLRNSGKFNPLSLDNLPEYPRNINELKPEIWSDIGIKHIITGQISCNNENNYNIMYQLIDINKKDKNIVMQNSFNLDKKWLRYAGHTISNEVFEKITGIKGAFCTRIAYISHNINNENNLQYQLNISDYDGYNKFTIHTSSQPLMSLSWYPNGSKLAYVTFENGHSELIIKTLSNGNIQHIQSFPRHNGAPSFSPDGTKLAFALSQTGSLNIYVMDLFSGKISQITNNRSNNTEPTWFPDSQNIAFTSDQSGRPQIYKININDKITERITWNGLQNQNAKISHDGKFMIMVSFIDGKQRLTKQDFITGNVKNITTTFLDETPSIAPNDTMLIYSSSLTESSMLNLISIDGHFKTCLPFKNNGQIKFPTWSPYLN